MIDVYAECPECQKVLSTHIKPTDKIECPYCNSTLAIEIDSDFNPMPHFRKVDKKCKNGYTKHDK